MRDDRGILTCIGAVAAMLLAGSAPARADRKMVVLIDASGSMGAARNNADQRGATRFEAAKALAGDRVVEQAGAAPNNDAPRVAVFTFRGATTLIPATRIHNTLGFLNFNDALDEIEALSLTADVGGSTPLAGAMCEAINVLANTDATVQVLQVSSDGEENATPPGTLCQGTVFTGTVASDADYPSDSYQRKVLNHIANVSSVIIRVDLFKSEQITFRAPTDAERILPQQARPSSGVNATADPLEQFFTFVTEATGGVLTVADDDEPLPLIGDLNADRCVNRDDAILVARSLGSVAPGTGKFDLNLDRSIDFADYFIQASRIGSACGPDPFVPRAPIVCNGPRSVVIDGQAIESGAVTIDVRSACQITIKNSLIVSGQNAISLNGSAVVRVDNSIIVGPNALLGTRGTIILSAANTVFHGKLVSSGAINFIDRGGNVFE